MDKQDQENSDKPLEATTHEEKDEHKMSHEDNMDQKTAALETTENPSKQTETGNGEIGNVVYKRVKSENTDSNENSREDPVKIRNENTQNKDNAEEIYQMKEIDGSATNIIKADKACETAMEEIIIEKNDCSDQNYDNYNTNKCEKEEQMHGKCQNTENNKKEDMHGKCQNAENDKNEDMLERDQNTENNKEDMHRKDKNTENNKKEDMHGKDLNTEIDNKEDTSTDKKDKEIDNNDSEDSEIEEEIQIANQNQNTNKRYQKPLMKTNKSVKAVCSKAKSRSINYRYQRSPTKLSKSVKKVDKNPYKIQKNTDKPQSVKGNPDVTRHFLKTTNDAQRDKDEPKVNPIDPEVIEECALSDVEQTLLQREPYTEWDEGEGYAFQENTADWENMVMKPYIIFEEPNSVMALRRKQQEEKQEMEKDQLKGPASQVGRRIVFTANPGPSFTHSTETGNRERIDRAIIYPTVALSAHTEEEEPESSSPLPGPSGLSYAAQKRSDSCLAIAGPSGLCKALKKRSDSDLAVSGTSRHSQPGYFSPLMSPGPSGSSSEDSTSSNKRWTPTKEEILRIEAEHHAQQQIEKVHRICEPLRERQRCGIRVLGSCLSRAEEVKATEKKTIPINSTWKAVVNPIQQRVIDSVRDRSQEEFEKKRQESLKFMEYMNKGSSMFRDKDGNDDGDESPERDPSSPTYRMERRRLTDSITGRDFFLNSTDVMLRDHPEEAYYNIQSTSRGSPMNHNYDGKGKGKGKNRNRNDSDKKPVRRPAWMN